MLLDHLEVVYCEMAPGTVLFFDCNLLHRSDPNESDESRWALICCYNSVDKTQRLKRKRAHNTSHWRNGRQRPCARQCGGTEKSCR